MGFMTDAMTDVVIERLRQVKVEGFDAAHDDKHQSGELSRAAACYILGDGSILRKYWPWDDHWWKPTTYRRNRIKAIALLLAEVERHDRAEALKKKS